MAIAALLDPDRVVIDVEARSKKHALEILSELLVGSDDTLDPTRVFDHLVERERLGSTGLGDGVALPHGRVAGIEETVGAVLRLSEGVDFDSPDGDLVTLIFGLVLPEECADDHLKDLAAIAGLLSDDDVRRQLYDIDTSAGVFELLAGPDLAEPAGD